jgi:hypothetical protein
MTSCTAEAAEHKYGNESECSFRRAFSCYFSHSILRHNVIVILWQFSRVAGWLRANSLNKFGVPTSTDRFLFVSSYSSRPRGAKSYWIAIDGGFGGRLFLRVCVHHLQS